MATKNFKGFQLVSSAWFSQNAKDKDTLYFVRTNEAKSDGFLYFNDKKYGTAEDAKAAVLAKFGNLGDKTVEAYVNEKIAAVTTAATALEGKVNANTEAIKTINGEGAGSIKQAVSVAKTELIGDAAEGYNTLGKLEDKIQEEASTARAAESKNATAAADAKAAANQAQATADAKVASVTAKDGETAIEVDNTTATTPKISLKLDNDGNVQFVQTAKGLKGSVEIPEATVTGVKADDKFLSLADKLVSADVSIAYDAADKKIYLYGKDKNKANAVSSIDCTDFIKDGMLTDAKLVTNPSGETEGTYIKLTWNTDGGKEPMYINVTSLIDIYTAGNGLNLDGHEFSVNFDVAATKASVDTVAGKVSTLEGKVTTIEGTGDGSIKKAVADEASRAKAAEKKNADAITILNGDSGVTGSVDQKIKTALEKGAVTLEVKDNDAYLGVTSTTGSNGTVYTLASKADEINNAIKAEADKVKVSVASAEGAYVTASVDEAGRAITLREKVQPVEGSSASAKGLAEASDVKNYVDQKVSGKNVSATGDALVSASAADNKVTVGATKALTSAVGKANSAVQSVNGVTGTAVTLDATKIEVGAGVGQQVATAKVNAVLADIYDKLGVVVKADGKTIKEADDHTLSVNLEAKETAQANGHVALEHGEDGALYGVMYYSGDDVDAQ